MMAGEGKSPTAIAREYFATDRPNGNQIKEVQQLLSAAERARQTNGNGTTPTAFQAA
ncbi:MAG: hypothetical protein HC875_36870 [Anaerolineales bacterium]|nr:hypothetical protein [Anaerolineales bacterium]